MNDLTAETVIRLVDAFLFSVVLLITFSGIGLAMIESMEETEKSSPKPKWFV